MSTLTRYYIWASLEFLKIVLNSKTLYNGHSKMDKTQILRINDSLMKA